MDNKEKQSDELLSRIRSELTAILAENASNDPERKISYDMIMKPSPLSSLEQQNRTKQTKKNKSKHSGVFQRPQTYRQSMGGKSITMKPSTERLTDGQQPKSSSNDQVSTSSVHSAASVLSSRLSNLDRSLAVDFMESQSAKTMDEDIKRMQLELGESYKLFQSIGEKLENINFSSLKSRIRDLHLSNNNDLNKITTSQLKKSFEENYLQNRLDKITTDVSDDFRRHPGEFGDIPELSSFFQACAQLEHGLDSLKQQRKRSSELEQRLCWANEIAFNRMQEIRYAVGDKPKTNF
ncbi:uncharacterized protein LOC133838436 [Drosophila sulfurigaster albostrigata]|uniref:uncharacterized protein LOC133838436 n=1 Tax=Drosophila sulfurigaster albostrigata TaxID=89887 RepID=UPI002D21D94F|nr:uncharacterized protein LOC133838436 [Drosophila sulfurigaster albostrigata]